MLRNTSIILFILFSFFNSVPAQEAPEKYLEVRGISEFEMEPLSRATATLYEGSTKIKSVQTGSDGSFSFRLDINKQYNIQVEKEGLISKSISFDTRMPDEEKGTWMSEFSMGLIKPCSGIDYSVLKQPVDRVSFDAKRREYVSDKDYVNSLRPKIEALMVKTDQCLLQTYEDLVKKADQEAKQNNLQEAKKIYEEALKIYPTETYPSKRIAEINNNVAKQQVSSEVYKGLITEADDLAKSGRLAEAIQKYEKAGSMNPAEAYPKQKVDELKSVLEQQQAQKNARQLAEDKYNQAMAKASVAYTRKDYAQARQYYQEALVIKPDESLPKTRVQEIQVLESKKAAEDAAHAEEIKRKEAFEKEYLGVVAQADMLFKEKKFEEAKAQYAKAITMKPAESYPAQRVKVIENAVASEQMAIVKASEDGYKESMAAASNALAKNQFETARKSYQKALTFKVDDLQAKKGIAEADRLEAEFAQRKGKEEQYNQTITSGDAYIAQKNWAEARQMFDKAILLKPGDKYAQTKIAFIENSVAAEQAARLKVMENEYKSAFAAAGKAISQKQYGEAKIYLQKALVSKPDDELALAKIAEIDRIVLDEKNRAEQAQNIARQYQETISKAEKYLTDKDYPNAKTAYNQALQVKPGDQYAIQKITLIDNLVSAEQTAQLKQTESAYADAMNQGNSALIAKNYEDAKTSFQKALTIKPSDNSAKSKITQVELLMKQEQDRILAEQSRKSKYDAAIKSADQFFTQENFASAKTYYQQALDLMPAESYPRQRLDESTRQIENREKLMSELKARDNAYNQALINADKYYKARDYVQAKDEYARASVLKPEENLPKTKLAEIENLIAARDKEIADAKLKADSYTAAMNSANTAFGNKNYTLAKESYITALRYMPGDLLATEQIKKIDYLVAEAEKIRKNEEARKTAFDALISSADSHFDNARYNDAKLDYKKALALDPVNAYAKQKIARIDEINRLLSQTPVKQNQQVTETPRKVVAAIPMAELNFKNESERQLYLDELVKKYPPGITLEKYKEKYKETYRYIVIRNNEAQEFRHILFTNFNGAQYSVNGKPITLQYFNSQTRVREGESFKEIVMQ